MSRSGCWTARECQPEGIADDGCVELILRRLVIGVDDVKRYETINKSERPMMSGVR